MNNLDILLIIVVIYAIYVIHSTKAEYFNGDKEACKPNNSSRDSYELDSYLDELISKNDTRVKKSVLNKNFINTQFHNDYRDVITAFNNMVPSSKQIFNIENIPLDYSEPDVGEVKGLVKSFISNVNENTSNLETIERNSNTGWDEPLVTKRVNSGWDNFCNKLGIPPSIYDKPLGVQKVKLLAIKRIQKYETDNQSKYTCIVVLQKKHANDQMVVKVSFVIDKNVLNNDTPLLY